MAEDRDDGAGSGSAPADVSNDTDGSVPEADGATDEWTDDATLDGRGGPRPPRETVDDLSEEDLTDLDEVEGIQIESPDTPIERGTIDRENAVFVVLGIVLSVLVFLEFVSVLPGG